LLRKTGIKEKVGLDEDKGIGVVPTVDEKTGFLWTDFESQD